MNMWPFKSIIAAPVWHSIDRDLLFLNLLLYSEAHLVRDVQLMNFSFALNFETIASRCVSLSQFATV